MQDQSGNSSTTTTSIEALSTTLNQLRVKLADEVKQRYTVIKPLEQILTALKEPHHHAVALYEATALLRKADKTLIPDAEFDTTLNQLSELAQDKLSELEFSFARDLRAAFEEKGITLTGEPHELISDLFIIRVSMARREVQITFSKQPVTDKKIKLDVNRVLSTYLKAKREICERNVNIDELLRTLFEAYQRLAKLNDKSIGARLPVVECYRELVLIKQPASFRKSPSKQSFADYPKTHFIFDLLRARQEHKLTIDGYRLELGTSTIDVGADSARALFFANNATQGQYIKDIYFEAEKKR